jgi:flagellar protein FlaG
MAGTTVSEMIFFIAAIVISSMIAVVLIDIVGDFSANLGDEASVLRGEMQSRLDIINDQMNVPYDNSTSTVTFYVMNTGTGELDAESLVVAANGTTAAGSGLEARFMGGERRWLPGVVMEVNFTVDSLAEDIDYNGWASTSGISDRGEIRGHTTDSFVFRIRGF